MAEPNRPYREVRALERGLALLDAMADMGWSSPTALANRAGIDRSSAYRLLATLAAAGFAVRRDDGRYYLAPKVQRIGLEIRQDDLELQTAQSELDVLVVRIGWPSDYAVIKDGRRTIAASTHPRTTMTVFRRLIGQHRPLLRSALGRAMLAAMDDGQLAQTLELVRAAAGEDASEIEVDGAVTRAIEQARRDGFGASHGLIESGTSAIALPVRRDAHVIGAVNIVFFSTVLTPATAAARFLQPLRDCVERIERQLGSLH
jgi:IclR family transcriptional regulator, mhp operon transcriptional activator